MDSSVSIIKQEQNNSFPDFTVQRIIYFACKPPNQILLQEKLQESKLGHLIVLPHFYESKDQTFCKLQTPQPIPTDPSQQNLQDK